MSGELQNHPTKSINRNYYIGVYQAAAAGFPCPRFVGCMVVWS